MVTPTDEDIPLRNGKLTYQDIGLLVQMREQKGMTQVELANFFGVTQGQVSRLLAAFQPTTRLAKLRLAAESDRVARATLSAIDKAAQLGDANPGLELLDRLDVAVKKRAEGGSGGAKVMIVVGGGANVAAGAIPELPTIDVDPS